ncbi:MAG: hypothetical protein AUG51_01660 [Acidobacteria bacterium 13_1_20CM_3_53_8]|nr:MAG: hypothetical protein AUG51_01660 [Acidobacteria bacterium 13_1_20CM_3_53_8]
MSCYNLCLLGFGNVGRALAELLVKKDEEMREEFGIEWRITGVATRRMGWLASPEGFDLVKLLAGDVVANVEPQPYGVREWLKTARADVLFETTSLNHLTGRPAIDYLRAALEAGAHAITANKGAVVHGYRELSELARNVGKRFFFEATCLDSAPVFSLFRETLPAARLLSFKGIFNSTTTVILEEMEAGKSFEDGVRRAQALGITETDPSQDVDGWDAAVKLCAIANVLMSVPLKLDEIEREGIRGLNTEKVRAARDVGRPFRLVARAARTIDNRVVASVRPEQISGDDPLGAISGTSLMVHFELDMMPGLTVTSHHPNLQSTAYAFARTCNALKAQVNEN